MLAMLSPGEKMGIFIAGILILPSRAIASIRQAASLCTLRGGWEVRKFNHFIFNDIPVYLAKSLVFIDIPASFASFPQRSFVFIDIPGSFVQKRIPSELYPGVIS
jgi:hypothetical protein